MKYTLSKFYAIFSRLKSIKLSPITMQPTTSRNIFTIQFEKFTGKNLNTSFSYHRENVNIPFKDARQSCYFLKLLVVMTSTMTQ